MGFLAVWGAVAVAACGRHSIRCGPWPTPWRRAADAGLELGTSIMMLRCQRRGWLTLPAQLGVGALSAGSLPHGGERHGKSHVERPFRPHADYGLHGISFPVSQTAVARAYRLGGETCNERDDACPATCSTVIRVYE